METAMEVGEDFSTPDVWSSEMDISQLCRVCANTNEYLIPIFNGEGLEHDLESKIAKHLPIKVSEEDKLPTHLCYQCASTLIAWHDLVVTCIEAEDKFKSLNKEATDVQAINDSCISESNGDIQTIQVENQLKPDISVEDQTVDQTEPVLDNAANEPGNIIIEGVTSMESQPFEEVPSDLRWEYSDKDYNGISHSHSHETSSCKQSKLQDDLLSYIDNEEQVSTLYSCNICNISNMVLEEFLKHSNVHSIEEKISRKGNLVGIKTTKKTDAFEGYKVQSSIGSCVKLYLCTICGQGNLMLKNLEQHSLLHPSSSESNFCNLCQQRFKKRSELETHLQIHLDSNDLTCQFCNKKFTIIDDLELHEGTHVLEEFVCLVCHQSFKSEVLVLIHFEKSHSTGFNCQICHTYFKTRSSMNAHFMSHVYVVKKNVKYFTCKTCQKKYDSNISLQRHILFVHNNRLPYLCEFCGFNAYHEEPLKRHLALEHKSSRNCTEKNPYSDMRNEQLPFEKQFDIETNNPEIDCTFKTKSGLKNSLAKKPFFNCKQCNKTFDSEKYYNLHLNVKHCKNTINKKRERNSFQFVCKICKAVFKLEFELEDHIKGHSRITYQCHVCLKDFKTDAILQKHVVRQHCEEMEGAVVSESASDESDSEEGVISSPNI